MRILRRAASIGFAMIACALPATAGETPWLTHEALLDYAHENMSGGRAYGTAIRCRSEGDTLLIKLTYEPFSGDPPFYRWKWVTGPADDLDAMAQAMRLKGRPELTYRIVDRWVYTDESGDALGCALIYR